MTPKERYNTPKGRARGIYSALLSRVKKYNQAPVTFTWETVMQALESIKKCQCCGVELTRKTKGATNTSITIDHCHKTGDLRGIVCGLCNTTFIAAAEDEERLSKARAYILLHKIWRLNREQRGV